MLRALSGGLFPFFPIFFFPWKISDSGKIVSVGLLQRQPCRRHADAFPLKGRQWFRTDLVGSGFSYPLRDTRNALALVPRGDSRTLLMEKKRVSAILNEIGMLLELKGENPFKCRAYGNAARVIEGLAGDLGELVKSGELSKIKGIGEALSQKITELVTTGPNRGTDDRANLQSSN